MKNAFYVTKNKLNMTKYKSKMTKNTLNMTKYKSKMTKNKLGVTKYFLFDNDNKIILILFFCDIMIFIYSLTHFYIKIILIIIK
jgi:hypothetical protein